VIKPRTLMVRSLAYARDDIASEDHKGRSGDSQRLSTSYKHSTANRHFFLVVTN